jgi:hypothetical protein
MWAGLRYLNTEKSERIEALNDIFFFVLEGKMGETVARASNGSERTVAAERRGELIVVSIQTQLGLG